VLRHDLSHLPAVEVPLALHELHRVLAVDAPVVVSLVAGDGSEGIDHDDELSDRFFSSWTLERLTDAVTGAGFTVESVDPPTERSHPIFVTARRARTLADTVGAGMRVLLCGLNPSVISADLGYGFASPSNRFWKAASAAGIVTVARDPRRALEVDGVGMTDVVKRATPRSSELTRDEYRAGAERVERLVRWLAPDAICFVGLEGWRAVVDRSARPGWQAVGFGGRPAYVMPSTSGLNASSSLDDLVDHLRAVAGPPPVPEITAR
jgi:TDG/mug DNA glycosylase family protein